MTKLQVFGDRFIPAFWQWDKVRKPLGERRQDGNGEPCSAALKVNIRQREDRNFHTKSDLTCAASPFSPVAFCASDVQCAINRCAERASGSCQSATEEALSYDTKNKDALITAARGIKSSWSFAQV